MVGVEVPAHLGKRRTIEVISPGQSAAAPARRTPPTIERPPGSTDGDRPATVVGLMGSLIKKRRKRMRKKKHKKMLKRTRWQRRAAGK